MAVLFYPEGRIHASSPRKRIIKHVQSGSIATDSLWIGKKPRASEIDTHWNRFLIFNYRRYIVWNCQPYAAVS